MRIGNHILPYSSLNSPFYLITFKKYRYEIIGRVTADAKVNKLKDERKVVNFSIAINDSYRAKGNEQRHTGNPYVQCTYWSARPLQPI